MRQVVTELDFCTAMCDYMVEQLLGRFDLQFPDHVELIEHMAGQLRNPHIRESVPVMLSVVEGTVSQFGASLTQCSLSGCDREENHRFMREFINLVWDARELTGDWLRGKGIVPGQSVN